MKKPAFVLSVVVTLFITSCKDDDSRSCISCSSDQTPTFELCRESNGNASVNGQDTGTDYELYLDGLIEVGTNCGGM